MHIRETEIPTLIGIGQSFVIDSHQMKDRRLQVVDMNRILGDTVSELIRFTMHMTTFDSAAGHPHRVAMWMMISA